MSAPNKIRELRMARLWSQFILAKRARVALRTVHAIEKGKPCRLCTKRRLLRALGIPFEQWRDVFPTAAPAPKPEPTQSTSGDLSSLLFTEE
jgi:DNA-binding XRE family transcriptional regulator